MIKDKLTMEDLERFLEVSCVDIDGVFSENPTDEQNDDGPKYLKFLTEVKPKYTPTTKIHTLVTCRLEKYRKVTVDWLKKYNIKYDRLIMMDYLTRKDRIKANKYVEYKSDVYKKATETVLFIESEGWQAEAIAKATGKRTLHIRTMKQYWFKKNINTAKYWNAKWKASENYTESDMHERFMSLFKFIKVDSSILDLGCGSGDLLKELYTYNISKKLYGVEISDYGINLAKKKVPIAQFYKTTETPEELPFKDIDVLICSHTIEHLENPAEYLKLWFRSAKMPGIALLVFPLEDEDYCEHLKSYTLKDIEKLVKSLCSTYNIFVRQRHVVTKDNKFLKEALAVLYFNAKPSLSLTIDKGITYDKTYVPTDIYIEGTNHCNATCKMCPHRTMKRKLGIMDWELFTKIILDFKKLDIKLTTRFWLHHLGEPLLDPLLIRRIKFIKKELKNAEVAFSTNGALLTKEKSEEILKAGLDMMVISLDSLTPSIYYDMRGLNLKDSLKNMDDLLEVKERLNSKMEITMQMVVNRENEHEEKAFREKWANKDVKVIIKPMHSFLTEGTSIMTDKILDKQILLCVQPFLYMIIYWNGDLGLCCWDSDNYIKDLGNVRDQSLLEAFNNDKFKEIRKKMLSMDCKDLYPCNQCLQIFGQDMNYWIFQKRLRIRK